MKQIAPFCFKNMHGYLSLDISICNWYLFFEAHNFPIAKLEENCSFLETNHVRHNIREWLSRIMGVLFIYNSHLILLYYYITTDLPYITTDLPYITTDLPYLTCVIPSSAIESHFVPRDN